MSKRSRNQKKRREQRQELLSAYIDGVLSPQDRVELEQALARDTALRTELEELQMVVQRMRAAPTVPLPRSFTLDPAVYGRAKRRRLVLFPILQTATVVTTILFIFAFAGGWLVNDFLPQAAEVVSMADEMPLLGEPQTIEKEVVVTQVVEREVEITEVVEVAGEEKVVEEVVVTEVVEVEAEIPMPAEEVPSAEPEAYAMTEAPAPEPTSEPAEEAEHDSADVAPSATAEAIAQAPSPTVSAETALATPTESPMGGTSAGTVLPSPSPTPAEWSPTPTPAPTASPLGSAAPTAAPAPAEGVEIIPAATLAPEPTGEIAAAPVQEAADADSLGVDEDDQPNLLGERAVQMLAEEQESTPTDWGLVAKIGLATLVVVLFVATRLARRFGW